MTANDEDLLRRVVIAADVPGRRVPRWVAVKRVTTLGSTNSAELCARFGLDPDELVGSDPSPGHECPVCGCCGFEDNDEEEEDDG